MHKNIKFKKTIDSLLNDLEEGLLFCDIWSNKSGLSVESHNPNPKYTAHFWRLTKDMKKTINNLGFPELGEFQLIDLQADSMLFLLYLDEDYTLGGLLDKNEVSLGLLHNLAIPNAFEVYRESNSE